MGRQEFLALLMIVVSEATGTRLQDKGSEIILPGYSVYFLIFAILIGEEVILFPRSSHKKITR